MPIYRVAPAPDLFVSDTDIPAEPKIGFEPTNKSNIAYISFSKSYDQYQHLGGFNVKIPKTLSPQLGDKVEIFIDNTTTNNATNSKTYSYTVTSLNPSRPLVAMVGVPDQKALGVGKLEIYGNLISANGNIIDVFTSAYIEQVLP
ncbi:hypothetical protein [Pseudomonas sp. KCJK9016]|uniref:hypothetical protein n=1 Tax=Pseudomonas sp. KCJK9016 TaxID=3344556 RepID=UPI0039057DD4